MLRDYQIKSIDGIRDAFRKGLRRVILALSTGAGKSRCAIEVINGALAKGKRIAFCVDRIILVDQFSKMAYDAGLKEFGIMQANNPLYNPAASFQIVTIQTLARRNSAPFDVVIYDEAHVIHKSLIKKMEEWKDSYWIGLTATPYTKGLGKYWQGLVNGTKMNDLIKAGQLCEYVVYGPSKPELTGVRTVGDDYNKKDLAEKTNNPKLIGDIVENWFKLANGKRTAVMAVNIAHAESIADEFKAKGIAADVIHCHLLPEDVKQKLADFKSGKLQVLSSVDMISRGFDMPECQCLIVARPTKSLNYHIQALGRVLRPDPSKEFALVLDHAGNVERLGFPCDHTPEYLDDGTPNEAAKRKKKEALPKPCPECFFIMAPKERKCPKCGFEKKKKSGVTVEAGNLQELQKLRLKDAVKPDKDKLYAKLLAGAKAVGFKDGWAAHKYKEYYGVWPKNKPEPDKVFYDWMSKIDKYRAMKVLFSLIK